MSIIPWSCLLLELSSPAGPGSPCYCCAAIISVICYPSTWSSAVIIPVICQPSTWSSELKFQVTYCLSTWSSSTWVFLVTCHLSAWSSITWSWFKVKNVNKVKRTKIRKKHTFHQETALRNNYYSDMTIKQKADQVLVNECSIIKMRSSEEKP